MPHRLRFRVIGPVEFHSRTGWHGIRSGKQRALLAALILKANRVVPTEQLFEELWEETPPASANTLLAGYVWRLRRMLGDRDGETIVTRAPGYQLQAPPGSLDIDQYETKVAAAHADLAAGQAEAAVAGFTDALALWRGTPLADVRPTPLVLAEMTRLEESRIAALEARIGAELELGRHGSVLPELKLLVSQHPLRERLHAHLMLALYRDGQQALALVAYRDLRQFLVNELGIEPSTALRELQQRILRKDPALLGTHARSTISAQRAAPPPWSGPQRPWLPPEPLILASRSHEASQLIEAVRTGHLGVVHGLVGVGKTALAIHVARQIADDYPDGPVFIDASNGIGGETIAADWRALLTGRRILVVLDDVGNAAPIRALGRIPTGCAVIVTCRSGLTTLDNAARVHVGTLTSDAARHMLRAHLGTARVDAEREAVEVLTHRCDGLPAALRIAAARLAANPTWTIASFVDRLADPGSRLDVLVCDDLSMRDRLAAGARLLPNSSLRALRLISDADLPVVTVEVLATLLNTPAARAEAIAERLVGTGLAEMLSTGQCRIPGLVRAFAREYEPGRGTRRSGSRLFHTPGHRPPPF
ncbi:AfsR/SARP family transcriptional regulator [Micromonospora sonneratiae]|uniref:BTAD domain-containing putative transcriptional regulator n=1 Tax=Micromonospora sonneratiae TaxID=1184706 RepID=A0ABW3YMU5_9ACTN